MRERRLTTQLVVRIDDRLRGALEDDARCSGRTLAQTARFYLDEAMNGVVCARCGAALEKGEG